MNLKFRTDGISGPAFRLVAGRVIGGVVSFAIPVVLARILLPAAFGTYKQLFLIYATLFGLAQLGAAESLYYFVPSKPAEAGRSVCNAVGTLARTFILTGDREMIRDRSAKMALAMLRFRLLGKPLPW